ncbi:Hypothetical predicted protein [Mytilus galloprovincialis]|uniref:Uncharacterized protein n=1 Tax=Mytilus galloprovincialis TaxID=29158 RepID=A0A8B6FIF8_MYTGA|nr:Hypothetical predicted protein [Mytilus galloprovincialis]
MGNTPSTDIEYDKLVVVSKIGNISADWCARPYLQVQSVLVMNDVGQAVVMVVYVVLTGVVTFVKQALENANKPPYGH